MPPHRKPCEYDIAILGGGSAGYAAAAVAAAGGARVAVIEGAAAVGGLCILRGCMPSKALLYAAEVLHVARRGTTWGLRIPRAGFDFARVMARKNAMVRNFANYRRQQLENPRFTFLRARARFIDAHALELKPRAGARLPRVLTARHFIVCTGSAVGPAPGGRFNEIGFLTSDEALALRAPPRSLIVVGGGPVALELAQFFQRLDTRVTLIQRGARVLREFDGDAAAALEHALRREGMKIFTATRLGAAFRRGKNKGVDFACRQKPRRAVAEEILVATGRIPNTAGLGLEQIGVRLERGRIVTDAEMQSSVPHILAAGDCTGPHQIVHIAVEQGEIAAHNIIHPGKKRRMDYRLLTSVVFTDPQVAAVGLTEKEARARNIPYLAARHSFADHGKALIMDIKGGFVKLLADPKTGEILGGACVGPMGGELIHEIIAAMHQRMTVRELAAMPHYHPTLAEIWTYPAAALAEKSGRR